MKLNKNIFVYAVLVTLGLSSCTKDFTDVNTDPIGEAEVDPNRIMTFPLVNILNANLVRNRNFNNELMQVTVDRNDAEGRVFRYDIRRTWADYTWNTWYVNATDLKDIYAIASKPGSVNKSYQGISLITQAWVYQLITDTYGDVPYTEANEGRYGNYQPVFDKQKDIYLDLFEKLEQANELLKENAEIVATSDPVYRGDIAKWRRFGNSLYLRLLLRVSGKAEVANDVIAKIKEIVDTNPGNYPIMENNSHTARILWNGTNSTTAAFSSPLMVSVRPVDFRGPGIASFFIDNLVVWNDPRIQAAYGANNVNRFGIRPGLSGYVGIPSGYAPGTSVEVQSRFYSQGETNNPLTLQIDPNTGIMMNCAEVDFILAEAAAKGWISGSARTYYYKGIADAINYWIPSLMAGGANDPAVLSYATAADIVWDDNLPLENLTPGTLSKMLLIHQQKYYALFLVDFQQWFEYRRTSYPILPKGAGLANGGKMPARLNYPLITQSTNPTNYKNAVAVQGSDDINTLVWWQKP
ncbi:SusD/RagB family nutrient-binding outer membrane lipoprotein [Pedobacter helvus]|uniref:SusD/RagB family nutrient-binding outer membrane lipoprotein n=1 Tax=Pedobacter helvus TaxID=2563444 RepID=A0ABW9JIS5_9SPHI|nr:SusD/RagB family nutrient-binding outer membrane lipoprotein [Pedobacter ureilyticus]